MSPFHDLFDREKRDFAGGVTRGLGWRIEQLNRAGRLVAENEAVPQEAITQDFKTASQEQIFFFRNDRLDLVRRWLAERERISA